MATEPTRQSVLGTNSLFQTINGKRYLCLCVDDWATKFNRTFPDEPTPEQSLVAINMFAADTLTEESRDGNPLEGISGTPNQMVAYSEPTPDYTTRDGKNVKRITITLSLDKIDDTATVINPLDY